jgi:DNA-damage-inducible protein D
VDIVAMFNLQEFEDMGARNGTMTWHEDILMRALDYSDKSAFRRVIMRGMQACLTLNINPASEFIQVGKSYKLTRFACYLVCMNADSRKKPVAVAQGYFAALADFIHDHKTHAELVDRIIVREEVRDGMKSLAHTVHAQGIRSKKDFALFIDAGYRGMYNQSLKEISERKGVAPGEFLLDRMNRMELAANLLRTTMTEARIVEGDIRGQANLEEASFRVGKVVRDALIEGTGKAPEDLPLTEHIETSKRKLKETNRRMQELSTPERAHEVDLFTGKETGDEPKYTPDPEEEPPPSSSQGDD